MDEDDPLKAFADRLAGEWLPTYCHDPKRRYSVEGYRGRSNRVGSVDARDFIWALDNQVVEHCGGGRYRAPRSGADVIIFWEGRKSTLPRPLTLSMEPVITIASMARLQRDYGWPTNCLAMEPGKWEFDFAAFLSATSATEHIVGEVKKSVRELDLLLEHLGAICRDGSSGPAHTGSRANAYKKWNGLCRSRAPLFWAVGPGGVSHVFEVAYGSQGPVSFEEVSVERLFYTGAT